MSKQLVLSLLVFTSVAEAATYYLSPSGSDRAAGTTLDAAWKTFAFALPKLRPGDTLLLADGTYARTTTGLPNIQCSSGSGISSGTAHAPITIKAMHDRRAFIQGDGNSSSILISKCSDWTVEGLRVENADRVGAPSGNVISMSGASRITIRRNLVSKPNRQLNSHAIRGSDGSSQLIIEDNEVYDFHRWGIICYRSSSCTVRRNYVNPRDGRAGLAGDGTGPLVGIGAYCTTDSLFENNLVEDVKAFQGSPGGGGGLVSSGKRNRFFGNIVRGGTVNQIGAIQHPASDKLECRGDDNRFENNVSVGGTRVGLYLETVANVVVKNHTSLSAGGHGLLAASSYDYRINPNIFPGFVHTPSFTVTNMLSAGNAHGYQVNHAQLFVNRSFGFSHGWNDASGVWRTGTAGTNSNGSPIRSSSPPTPPGDVDPRLGTCVAWVPDGSPMKRAGASGADVGSNVLYRYQNGNLTSEPLWVAKGAGEFTFPCGEVVRGVNDVGGRSCTDAHVRLNINRNGCALPRSFGAPGPISPNRSPKAPSGLTVR